MIDGKFFSRYLIFLCKKCKGKIMELKTTTAAIIISAEVVSDKKPAILARKPALIKNHFKLLHMLGSVHLYPYHVAASSSSYSGLHKFPMFKQPYHL